MVLRKRLRGILLAAALAAVALAVRGQAPASPEPPAPGVATGEGAEGIGLSFRPPRGALVAPGRAPDLTLLYTGDVIGYVDHCGCPKSPAGGLARRGWVIGQHRDKYPETPVLLLDSGNFSDNPTPVGDVKTRGLIEGMGRLGYAVSNVGERELMMGYEEFLRRTEGAKFPFVSTNIIRQDTKDPVFKPYVVLEAKRAAGQPPLRVGVLGVVRFNPLFLKSGPDKSNLVIASPIDMVRRYLDDVRKRSDVVVVLAALHRDDAFLLARELPGIDFVFGAYGGFYSTTEEAERGTRIVYTGNQGQRLGETRVFLEPGQAKVAAAVSYMHFLTEAYPDDDAMRQFVLEVEARVGEQKSAEKERIEEIRVASGRNPYSGAEACRGCHASQHAQWSGTPHAKAWETLTAKNEHRNGSCVVCHVTAAGEEGGFRDPRSTPGLVGVTCESCHGAGAEHAANPKRGYGKVALTTCLPCHNKQNSPKFDYYAYLPRVLHTAQSFR